jgi:hypothetical protein
MRFRWAVAGPVPEMDVRALADCAFAALPYLRRAGLPNEFGETVAGVMFVGRRALRSSDDLGGKRPRAKLRARGGALLGFGVLALMGGCGSDGAGAIFVDPAHYSFYRCEDLAARRKALSLRENELRGLMEKAGESTGGSVIGSFAYRSDYDTVLAEEKLVDRTATEKNCNFTSPTQFQSDQTIR